MIIGTSGAIHAGKNTLADHLVKSREYALLNTSDAIVVEVKQYFKATLDVYCRVRYDLGVDATVPAELHHRILVTQRDAFGRAILQDHGVSRRKANEDYWLPIWIEDIEAFRDQGLNVVIPGIRYPNEVQMIHLMGGKVVRVQRNAGEGEYVGAIKHEVEHGLDDWTDWDLVIDNELDVVHLMAKFEDWLLKKGL